MAYTFAMEVLAYLKHPALIKTYEEKWNGYSSILFSYQAYNDRANRIDSAIKSALVNTTIL